MIIYSKVKFIHQEGVQMSKKSRLGRSLDILLNQTRSSAEPSNEIPQRENSVALEHALKSSTNYPEIHADKRADIPHNNDHQVINLPIEKLRPGQFQPRKFFDETALAELAHSLKTQGILQPLVVRPVNDLGDYEIVAGERRWRAAQLAKLHDVPVIVKAISDREALAIAIIENIQREDLSAIEEATALAKLINEFELTHQETGELIGRSRSAISNLLRLLELPDSIQEMLNMKKIEMGHARALIPLDPLTQLEISNIIILRGLSVRETENLIKQRKNPSPLKQMIIDPNIKSLERQLSDTLGSKVNFKHQANGHGQIMIKYHSLDELDGIIRKIK